jgi:hypothetical protein
MDSYNNDTFLSNIKDSINFLIENHHKFLLLLFVFFIIYFVDYITHINTILYSGNQLHVVPILKTPNKNPKGKLSRRRR